MDVVVVAHNQAGQIKTLLKEKSLYNNKWLAKNLPDHKIALPVNQIFTDIYFGNGFEDDMGLNFVHFEVQKMDLQINSKKALSNPLSRLKNKLEIIQLWNEKLINDFPKSFEKFEDLLLLNNDSFKMDIWQTKGLWELVASAFNCRRIARKLAISRDQYRSPRVTMILGDSGYVEHIDNGVKYRYDITKCMFSPGNISEKLRISRFDCSSETVVDLYAGIGYFTLPYLVHGKARNVIACEWNPNAAEALRENLKLNKVSERCLVLEGDNRLTSPANVADRINLGLIPSSEEGWLPACRTLRKDIGGMMHVHGNVTSKQPDVQMNNISIENHQVLPRPKHSDHESMTKKCCKSNFNKTVQRSEWENWALSVSVRLKEILEEIDVKKWIVSVVHVEHVKSYAPHVDHVVADIECRPM